MVDSKPVFPTFEGEQHVIVAAKHIVKALEANYNLSDEFRKLLADFDAHLSTVSIMAKPSAGQFSEAEEQLKHAERKIMNWELNQSTILDSGPIDAAEYLEAVVEIRRLIESLGSMSSCENGKLRKLIQHAHFVLQMAMERLEDELLHTLLHRKQPFGGQYISSSSHREDSVNDNNSLGSNEHELVEKASAESCDGKNYEYMIDLVYPDVIPYLKSIANVMIRSCYDQEFCEAYVSTRKEALNEYLDILEVDQLGIEDVIKLDSDNLNRIIRRWTRAMKILIRMYLTSEKWLCEQIMGKFGPIPSVCFIEISKASIFGLLNLGEAIAMVPHPPDQLFSVLNMYDVLADLLVDVDTLYSVETGSFIRTEFTELLKRVGGSARATLRGFLYAISSNTSTTPFPKGGVHHLTKYVTNYITTLSEYSTTLNIILQDCDEKITDTITEPEIGQGVDSHTFCPAATHLRLITSILQTNLDRKSELYKDASLQHIFLMNNINYVVQKVKSSNLKKFIGDEWIRNHIVKLKQHARSYERETWNSVISLLKDDVRSSLKSFTTALTKQRFKQFSLAFDDIYRIQIGWSVPDHQLRKELQISISQKLIPAYRNFAGRNSSSIPEKYIKYTDDDLEMYLIDLFEGAPRSLNPFSRK